MGAAIAVRPGELDAGAILLVGTAALIAAVEPFDRAFAAATLGSPTLRAAAMAALALVGVRLARRQGFPLGLHGPAPLRCALAAALGVALWCVGCDVAFRASLHPRYAEVITTAPLPMRTAAYMMRAFNESVLYRMFLGSLLAAILGRVWRGPDGRRAPAAVWTGFAAAQVANVWLNVTSQAPLSLAGAVHDVLRYVAPGLVWSWLYLRRGFAANELAATTVHLAFQPLAGLVL